MNQKNEIAEKIAAAQAQDYEEIFPEEVIVEEPTCKSNTIKQIAIATGIGLLFAVVTTITVVVIF